MHLSQVAFSITDNQRMKSFYCDLLGFRPSGGTRRFRGPAASKIQGLPDAASTCRWYVDGSELFQLEMFEFESPKARPRPAGWRPCDIGYTRITLAVAELESLVDRLGEAGYPCIAGIKEHGGRKRACVSDPEGVLVELVQAGVGELAPGYPVAFKSVALSVPDLEKSKRFLADVLGVPMAGDKPIDRDELWGLPDAKSDSLLFRMGRREIELRQYHEPVPAPRPEDYRLSDQGLLNMALGFRNKRELRKTYERALTAGYRANCRIFDYVFGSCVYLNDDQGFSVELISCWPVGERFIGFREKTGMV
jgi:catechol 2,3-dioxygenase-like lactoylglutathione lyase family enzyme